MRAPPGRRLDAPLSDTIAVRTTRTCNSYGIAVLDRDAFRMARSDTWRAIRIWMLVLVAGMIGFATPFWLNRSRLHTLAPGRYSLSAADERGGQFTLGLVSFVATAVAVIGITVGVRRRYRCPKCNAVPTGTWSTLGPGSFGLNRGVAINPSLCPSCRAPLVTTRQVRGGRV